MDSPLTEQGQQQAIDNGRLLYSLVDIDVLWVSPLGRTAETANLVNSTVQAPIEYVDALMERDCGHWGGLTLSEIQRDFSESWQARMQDSYNHRPPNGENLPDLVKRVAPFVDQLYERSWLNAAIITHGVMSRALLQSLLGLSDRACMDVRHPNDLVYSLDFYADRIEPAFYRHGGERQPGLFYTDDERE